jgi:hypothetical protein
LTGQNDAANQVIFVVAVALAQKAKPGTLVNVPGFDLSRSHLTRVFYFTTILQ